MHRSIHGLTASWESLNRALTSDVETTLVFTLSTESTHAGRLGLCSGSVDIRHGCAPHSFLPPGATYTVDDGEYEGASSMFQILLPVCRIGWVSSDVKYISDSLGALEPQLPLTVHSFSFVLSKFWAGP